MNNIQLLDCTLRDGGYCNDWHFGFDNAKKIINGLQESGIEIIECGFLTNSVKFNSDITKFTSIEEASRIIPNKQDWKKYVLMMNYGDYNIDDLPDYDGSSIDGIRVAFHKKNMAEALCLCKKIKDKGYLVFVQAMVSLSYSDKEFLDMIQKVNSFNPYAFYIVDSFGMMKEKDLIRLFFMIEHNLNGDIWIGFHSHNNMQLAYSNAQKLTNLQTNRNLIIDSSIYGMGRGAGNLNTELFIEYLNENAKKNYKLKPILTLIDEILNEFYQQNYWGYSLPNYISAAHNAHPNYARYLDDKKTLTIEAMNDIFDMMDDEKKNSYDKTYIEDLYLRYMASGKTNEERKSELEKKLDGKKIVLVAPGKSSIDEANKIISFVDSNSIVISINHSYELISSDFIFISNLRRFRELPKEKREKCIVSSNIPVDNVYYQPKYNDLINSVDAVVDNAGLMAIKLLMDFNVKKVYLAGFDGYSHDVCENYGDSDMSFISRNAVLDSLNIGMSKVLNNYSKDIQIEFLTTPKHVRIDNNS